MVYDLVSLRVDAIDRPPHWRWLRASRCVQENRPTDRRRDDMWVSTLIRFIRQLNTATTPEAIDNLADHSPVLYWVHRTATSNTEQAARLRTQLEARLLCRDFDPEATSLKTGLTVSQVEAYRHAFFDVRDRLDNIAWMTSQVLGPSVIDGFNPKNNSHLMLKMTGWVYGSMAVDLLVGRGYDGRPASSIPGLNAQVDAAESFETRLRSYLATRYMTIDQFTSPVMFQHAADMRRRDDDQDKVRRETGAASGEMGALKAMIDALSSSFRGQGSGSKPKAITEAVEPRASVLFAIANGDTSAQPANTVFPEVVSHDR